MKRTATHRMAFCSLVVTLVVEIVAIPTTVAQESEDKFPNSRLDVCDFSKGERLPLSRWAPSAEDSFGLHSRSCAPADLDDGADSTGKESRGRRNRRWERGRLCQLVIRADLARIEFSLWTHRELEHCEIGNEVLFIFECPPRSSGSCHASNERRQSS